MEILIFASARAEVAHHALLEYGAEGSVTALVPATVARGLPEERNGKHVRLIRLKGNSFDYVEDAELLPVKNMVYDVGVIVSGGQDFCGFDNVIALTRKFNIRKLVFYNCNGCKTEYFPPRGFAAKIERYAIPILMRLFTIQLKLIQAWEKRFC